jgi:hypothetical protein
MPPKGRRKSRSRSQGDFDSPDKNDSPRDSADDGSQWINKVIPGEGQYIGYMKNGRREGQGRFRDIKGGTFEGNWHNDLYSGFGIKTFSSGDRHEGNYVNGKRDGSGIYMWANGDSYNGMWSAGLMDGKGSFKWSSGKHLDQYTRTTYLVYSFLLSWRSSTACNGTKPLLP